MWKSVETDVEYAHKIQLRTLEGFYLGVYLTLSVLSYICDDWENRKDPQNQGMEGVHLHG